MFRFTTSAVFAAALVAASPAAAQQPDDQVETFDARVARGGELFQAGDYAAARAEWEKAYQLHQDPTLLFNIGSTYRREGDLEEALRYYQRYLEVAPADARYRAVAEEAVLNVQIQIDARKNAEEPEPAPEPPAEPPPAPGQGGTYLRWSGIGVGVLGLASLSFGIFQGLEARDLDNKLSSLPAGTEWSQSLQDDLDRGESLETQAVVFSIAGGVAVAVGGLLYVAGVYAEPERDPDRLSLAPYATGAETGLALSGSF